MTEEMIDAGIIDLGGSGELLLEIEYQNTRDEFKECVFRLPKSCLNYDIASGGILQIAGRTVLQLTITDVSTFNIYLPDKCLDLIEVRLPGAAGGDNITERFNWGKSLFDG